MSDQEPVVILTLDEWEQIADRLLLVELATGNSHLEPIEAVERTNKMLAYWRYDKYTQPQENE